MTNKKENSICMQIDLSSAINDTCYTKLRNPNPYFKDGKFYQYDKYYGDVIYSDEKIIQVECKNGNKYMEGQIITMHLVEL